MDHFFFIHSSVDGHLGCFHVLAVVNRAAVNTVVHDSFLISHQFFTHHFIHVNPNRPIHPTTTTTTLPLSPLGVHTFILYICVFWFLVYKSYAPFAKSSPKYLILFDAIVNGIVFLISCLDSLLPVFRNTVVFFF